MTFSTAELLASSPERWRYPQFAAAVAAREPPGTEEAARLILAGLAYPQTLYESLTALVRGGSFAVAEKMLLDLMESPADPADGLTDEQFRQVETELGVAQAAAIVEIDQSWADLDARAALADLPAETDPELTKLALSELREARARVATRATRITGAETTLRAEMEGRLSRQLSEAKPGPSAESWAAAVRTSLRAGEFGVAAAILAAGPGDVLGAGPLTVSPPPWRWPWADSPVAQVLDWYSGRQQPVGPEFGRYRPPSTDEAASTLLAALNAIAYTADTDTVRGLATALGSLIGDPGAPQAEDVTGGFVSRVLGLHDARLPQLPGIAGGMTLWVSASSQPDAGPPAELLDRTGPAVWFRPLMSAPARPAGNIAVLDVSTLLLLLAPIRPGLPPDADTRRVNLLRHLMPQLNPQDVLGREGLLRLGEPAGQRASLAWLFDLFRVLPDAAVLDGMLADFGSHPGALRCLADELIGLAVGRDHRLTVADLSRTRDKAMQLRIHEAVMRPLAARTLARMTLWLVLWHFDDDMVITAESVLDAAGFLRVSARAADRVVNRREVSRVLAELANDGLLRRADDGYRIPPRGLAAALIGHANPEPRGSAAGVLREIEDEVQSADDAAAAVLGRRITHFIGHRVDNDVISITGRLTRATELAGEPGLRGQLAEVATRVQALGGGTYVALYYQGLAPAEPVEVTRLVAGLVGDVEWHLPPGLHIRPQGDGDCWVQANAMILAEALRNLVVNSARVLAGLLRVDPKPAIQVSVRAVAQQGDQVMPIPAPAVVIEVADNGTGFPDEELTRLRAATDPASPPWAPGAADGNGQGIPMSASLLRQYGGVLEIGNGSRDLDGGYVRTWLPRLEAPTGS